jgi:predicted DNA-binding transcriptional regulator YafY
MYDGQVVAITVAPFEYDIVKIEGEAFIRINSETIRMSESMRRQLMAHRILSKKEDAANVAALMDAIESKRQVVLHGYSSSSSGEIKDRVVEPFAFAAGQKTVWCYEVATKANKVFKVDRISNVEIKADRWEYETHHRQGKMDIFRMTGDTPTPIKLQLTLLAKNVLVEEYPEAQKDLIPTNDDDRWILETEVYKMEGVGRFYMGLAGEIDIIEAKGLKDYAIKYSKEHIL